MLQSGLPQNVLAQIWSLSDYDNDGQADSVDLDDDGDGVLDIYDAFPLNSAESGDFDGDGIGDNQDLDDDNDGFLDILDANPRNAGISSQPPTTETNDTLDIFVHGSHADGSKTNYSDLDVSIFINNKKNFNLNRIKNDILMFQKKLGKMAL